MRPALLATLAGAAVLVPVGAASATSSCGAVNGGFENTIRATNIGCVSARKLVRRWHHRSVTMGQGPGSKYVGSYWCRSRATDPEHVRVVCTYGAHRVSFYAGP